MKRVIITLADDWEGLYVDGELVSEGHRLGEGKHRTFLLQMAEKYNFKFSDVGEVWVSDETDKYLQTSGGFTKLLKDLPGYDEEN